MVRSVIGILLAASVLTPVAASAQQDVRGDVPPPQHHDRGNRDRDARGPRGQQQGGRPDRGQVQVQAQAGVAVAPGPRPDGRGRDGAGFAQREGNQGYRQNRDPRQDYRGRDDRARNDPGRGDPGRGYDRRDDARSFADRRDQYADRRGFDDRAAWNNGWRSDRRYDWNRYRTANRGAYHLPRYYAPASWGRGYRRFSVGVTLGYGLFGQNYWIADPYGYRLPPAYGPYRWVRYYDDALLVDIRTGRVVDAVYGIFW